MNKNQEAVAMKLWCALRDNLSLRKLTFAGLLRGIQKGKSMECGTDVLRGGLIKQVDDWKNSYLNHDTKDKERNDEKRRLADIINNAGLLLLRLDEAFGVEVNERG